MQILRRNKIDDIKLKNFETVEDFFIEFEKSVNEFNKAGGAIDDTEKLRYLIKALPQSYSYIGDFIGVMPEKDRTVDYVKSKIKEKNLNQNQSDNRRNNVSTFATKAKGTCYICGKQGHHKKDCWHADPNSNARQDNGNQSDNHQHSQQRGNFRGRFQRGRGRGRGFQSNQSRGLYPRGQQTNDQPGPNAWSIQVCSEKRAIQCNKSESEKCCEINWLLDSGCTDHIVNDSKFFEKSVDLEYPIDVKVADGKMLKATKLGNMKVCFKTYYGENLIDIQNIYYVKDIKQNILGSSKITEKNCTIVEKKNNAKIYDQNVNLQAVANKIDGLYYLKGFVKNTTKEVLSNTTQITDEEKWHRALGHVNFQYLNNLVKNKLLDGLPEKIEKEEMKCATCIESKMTN